MDIPTFPRFAAAPKCDPAQLLDDGDLLLDRPVKRWSIPEPSREALVFAIVLAATAYLGWQSYRIGNLEQIEAQRGADRVRILGSEEAIKLMAADRASAAEMLEIEGVE